MSSLRFSGHRIRFVFVALLALAAFPTVSAHALSDGTPSTSDIAKFGTGFNNPVSDAVLQPDGKVVVVGGFTSYNGVAVPGIVRLNTDGTIDTGFNTRVGTGAGGSGITSIAIQANGSLVIGGGFTAWNGTPAGRIARILNDGTTDQQFITNVGSGISGGVGSSAGATPFDFEIQSDGKIVVVGDFTQFQGSTQEFVLRLNSDGTPDTAFNTNAAQVLDIYVYGVKQQSTGHLVIVGGNIGAGGSTNAGLVRLNSNGTLDSAFSTAIGSGAAAVAGGFTGAIAVLSDNSVLVGGKFTQFGTSLADTLASTSANGIINNSFASSLTAGLAGNMALSPYQWLDGIDVQTDNSLLLSGCFVTINGVSSPGIARLTTTGTVDTTFGAKLGTGFNGCVRRVITLADGKVMAFGDFTSLNGVAANGIAVLGTTPSPTTTTTTVAPITRRSLPSTGSLSAAWTVMSLVLVSAGVVLLRQKKQRI